MSITALKLTQSFIHWVPGTFAELKWSGSVAIYLHVAPRYVISAYSCMSTPTYTVIARLLIKHLYVVVGQASNILDYAWPLALLCWRSAADGRGRNSMNI